jgi:hypothetical protein
MMNASALSLAHVLWALGIGTAFAFWPILGKYSRASGAWVYIVVIVGSAIGGIGLAYSSLKEQPMPAMSAFRILLVAGMVNGFFPPFDEGDRPTNSDWSLHHNGYNHNGRYDAAVQLFPERGHSLRQAMVRARRGNSFGHPPRGLTCCPIREAPGALAPGAFTLLVRL